MHLGHVHLAQTMMQRLCLAQVLFVPTAMPALKQSPQIDTQHRLNMLALALQAFPEFVIDQREIERGGLSYSIDTLKSLRQQWGEQCSLVWLLGSDAFAQIDQWHEWQSLLRYAHFAIAERPNSPSHYQAGAAQLLQQHAQDEIAQLHQQAHGCLIQLQIAAPNISSSAIRQALAQGQSAAPMLNPAVHDYIQQQHLYQV